MKIGESCYGDGHGDEVMMAVTMVIPVVVVFNVNNDGNDHGDGW